MTSAVNELNIVACDDNAIFLQEFQNTLYQMMKPYEIRCHIAGYQSPEALLAAHLSNPDIFFLDVEMPNTNGIQLASLLHKENSDSKIVFLSNHDDYMQEAFKVRAFRYLLKDGPKEQIQEALDDAIAEIRDSDGVLLHDSATNADYFVRYKNILRIESIGDLSVVITFRGKYTLRRTLKKWMEQELDARFLLCHKSHIVNMQWVKSISRDHITLSNECTVPISPPNYRTIKTTYQQFLLHSPYLL